MGKIVCTVKETLHKEKQLYSNINFRIKRGAKKLSSNENRP